MKQFISQLISSPSQAFQLISSPQTSNLQSRRQSAFKDQNVSETKIIKTENRCRQINNEMSNKNANNSKNSSSDGFGQSFPRKLNFHDNGVCTEQDQNLVQDRQKGEDDKFKKIMHENQLLKKQLNLMAQALESQRVKAHQNIFDSNREISDLTSAFNLDASYSNCVTGNHTPLKGELLEVKNLNIQSSQKFNSKINSTFNSNQNLVYPHQTPMRDREVFRQQLQTSQLPSSFIEYQQNESRITEDNTSGQKFQRQKQKQQFQNILQHCQQTVSSHHSSVILKEQEQSFKMKKGPNKEIEDSQTISQRQLGHNHSQSSLPEEVSSYGENPKFKIKFSSVKRNIIADHTRSSGDDQIVSSSFHKRQQSQNAEFNSKLLIKQNKHMINHQKMNSNQLQPQWSLIPESENCFGDGSSSSVKNQVQFQILSQLQEGDFLDQDQDVDLISSLNKQCEFQFTQGFLLSQAQSPKITVTSTEIKQNLVQEDRKYNQRDRNRDMPLKIQRNSSVIKNYEDFINIRKNLDSANTTYSKLNEEASPFKAKIKQDKVYDYGDKQVQVVTRESRNQDLSASLQSSADSIISRDDPTCLTTNQNTVALYPKSGYLISKDESANIKSPFQKFLQKSQILSNQNYGEETRIKQSREIPFDHYRESPKKIKGFRGNFEYPVNQIIQETTQNFALSQLSFTQDISQINFQELQTLTQSSPNNYEKELQDQYEEKQDINYEDEDVKNEYELEDHRDGEGASRMVSPSRERNFISEKGNLFSGKKIQQSSLLKQKEQTKAITFDKLETPQKFREQKISKASSQHSLVEEEKQREQVQVIRSFSPIVSLSAQKSLHKIQKTSVQKQSNLRSSFAHFRTEQKTGEMTNRDEEIVSQMITPERNINQEEESDRNSFKYLSPEQRKHAQRQLNQKSYSPNSNSIYDVQREQNGKENQRQQALSCRGETIETEVANRIGEARYNNWVIDQEEKIKNIIQLNQQLIGKQLSLFGRSFEREMLIENGQIPSQKLQDTKRLEKVDLAKHDDNLMDISCKSSFLPQAQENQGSLTMDQFYFARQSPDPYKSLLRNAVILNNDLTQRSPILVNHTQVDFDGQSVFLDQFKTANEIICSAKDLQDQSERNPIEETIQLDYEFQQQHLLCESMISPSQNLQALNQSTLSQSSLQASKLNQSSSHLRQSFNQNNRLTKLAEGLRAQQLNQLIQSNRLDKSTEREGSLERSNWKSIVQEIHTYSQIKGPQTDQIQQDISAYSPGARSQNNNVKDSQRQITIENLERDIVTTPSPRVIEQSEELQEYKQQHSQLNEEQFQKQVNSYRQKEVNKQNLQEELFLLDIFESSKDNLMTFRPDQNSNQIFEVSRNVQLDLQQTSKQLHSIQSSPEQVVSVLNNYHQNMLNPLLLKTEEPSPAKGIIIYQQTPKKTCSSNSQSQSQKCSNIVSAKHQLELRQSFNEYTLYKLENEMTIGSNHPNLHTQTCWSAKSQESLRASKTQLNGQASPDNRIKTPEEVQEQLYQAILEENKNKRMTSQKKLRKNNSSIREQPSEEDQESALENKCASLVLKSNSQVSQVSQVSMRNFIMKESEIFNAQTKSAEFTENQTPIHNNSDLQNQRTLDFYENDEQDIEMPLQIIPSPSAQPDSSWKYKRNIGQFKVKKDLMSYQKIVRSPTAHNDLENMGIHKVFSDHSASKLSTNSAFSPVAVVSTLDVANKHSNQRIKNKRLHDKLTQFTTSSRKTEKVDNEIYPMNSDNLLLNIKDSKIELAQRNHLRQNDVNQMRSFTQRERQEDQFQTPNKLIHATKTERASNNKNDGSSNSNLKDNNSKHNFKPGNNSRTQSKGEESILIQKFDLKRHSKDQNSQKQRLMPNKNGSEQQQYEVQDERSLDKSKLRNETNSAIHSARSIIRGVCQSIQETKSKTNAKSDEINGESKNIVQRNLKKRMPKQKHYLQVQQNHQMIGEQFKPILSQKHLPQEQNQSKNPFCMNNYRVSTAQNYSENHLPQTEESFKITLFKTELLETSNAQSSNSSQSDINNQLKQVAPQQPHPYPQLNNSYFRQQKIELSKQNDQQDAKRLSILTYHPHFERSQQSNQNQNSSFAKYLKCNQNADSRRGSGQSTASNKLSLNKSIDQKKLSLGIESSSSILARQYNSLKYQTPKDHSKHSLSSSSITLLNTSGMSSQGKYQKVAKTQNDSKSTRNQQNQVITTPLRANQHQAEDILHKEDRSLSKNSSFIFNQKLGPQKNEGMGIKEQSKVSKEYFNISGNRESQANIKRQIQSRVLV